MSLSSVFVFGLTILLHFGEGEGQYEGLTGANFLSWGSNERGTLGIDANTGKQDVPALSLDIAFFTGINITKVWGAKGRSCNFIPFLNVWFLFVFRAAVRLQGAAFRLMIDGPKKRLKDAELRVCLVCLHKVRHNSAVCTFPSCHMSVSSSNPVRL